MNFPHWELLVTWPNWIALWDFQLAPRQILSCQPWRHWQQFLRLRLRKWRNLGGVSPNGWGNPGWFTSTCEDRTWFQFFFLRRSALLRRFKPPWSIGFPWFDQAVRRLYCILATNLRSAEYRELVQEARKRLRHGFRHGLNGEVG